MASDLSPESMSKVFKIPTCIPDLTDHIVQGEQPEATYSREYYIYKCSWDRPNYSPVALKVIRVPQLSNDADLKERYNELLQEIRVWGSLQNKHILPVLGHVYGRDPLPSLVFPWMENGSLTNFLSKHKTLERGERFRLLQDIASALQYLHVIAVVHGDLTGDNILVDSHRRAFVTGVGLSKRLDKVASNPESGSGDTRSPTICWIAPELVDDDDDDDEETFPISKSDVWSFGCNMIHVLSGELPWWSSLSVDIPLRLFKKKIPPLPPVIECQARDSSFLRKCFSFRPADRPSADQILAFVREALRSEMPRTAEVVAHDHDKDIPAINQHDYHNGIPDVIAEFKRRVFDLVPPHLIDVDNMILISRDELIKILKPENITEEALYGKWSRQSAIESTVADLLKYAILSHRWGDSEPTFQDLKRGGAGYKKLMQFRAKAKEYGCRLAWSDTCCINKESSSELDEAIRSMFTWYREAYICIVHLAHTKSLETLEKDSDEWFFRGWTLQELLASLRMRFYCGSTWKPLSDKPNNKDDEKGVDAPSHVNDKDNAEVVHALSRITKIPENDLRNFCPGPNRAWEKMTWAASRKTTRIEDVAYSLIGIFDITMSVAYGEGDRAFKRFMAELIEKCKEWQILVWAGGLPGCPTEPSCYHTADKVALEMLKNHEISWWGEGRGDADFSVTKRGVQVKLFVVPASIDQSLWQSTFLSRPPGRLMTSPLDKLVVESPFFPPASTTEWAIGIVNYHDHDDNANRGKLKMGQNYVCFLLWRFCLPGLDTVRNHWKREVTEKILTVRCKRDFEKELEIVWL
ncbi:kinase-like domain-containing protein [Suillus placidus]|uniref:Kinase-like domain-containing protein n=1 Tax=Suillus placidus TaxID=48579 RepID=A0A9P7A3J0_9AGAM|nr:kinase-like domain-containing protein [Suillus placidus]